MRYVDEFLYNAMAELKLWRARRRYARSAGLSGGVVARLGPLAGAFSGLAGARPVRTTGAEVDRTRS